MRSILICFCGFIFANWAAAQSIQQSGDVAETAFFLIDASGSMASKMDLAESRVAEKIAQIRESNPRMLVSRTYFGGENGGSCGSAISVSEALPIERDRALQVMAAGSTQLGEALTAAMSATNKRRSLIFLVSDGSETESCGPALCVVARKILTSSDVEVNFLPVAASATDIDRLGCLEGLQQYKKSQSVELGLNAGMQKVQFAASGGGRQNNGRVAHRWEEGSPIERWLWLIMFALFAGCAVCIAFRHGNRAVQYEKEIERVQTAQRADNNIDLQQEAAQEKFSTVFKPQEAPWYLRGSRILGGLGFLVLFALLFAPSTNVFDFQAARDLSWLVLSSNFANAFAIVEVTPILFAAAQMWRYEQAKRTYYLVSDAAAIEQRRRAQEEYENTWKRFQAQRQSLDKISFGAPWPYNQFRSSVARPTEEDRKNFDAVCALAVSIAQGEEKPTANLKELEGEIKRLGNYGSSWRRFSRSLADVIDQIDSDALFPEESVEEWRRLAGAVRRKDVRGIRALQNSLLNPAKTGS